MGPPGTLGDAGGRWGTLGDAGGRWGTLARRRNVISPGAWLLLVGQVQTKTGRDDKMLSALVLPQDGRTALLGILVIAIG